MRVVFLGTPEFAVNTLDALVLKHDVVEVVTQPDRPQGRRQELIPSPVKAAAMRHGIPVWQPERVRRPESVEHLRELAPGVMVVVGYGQIIPQSVIDIARLGIINVHASLLPELRGAAPIQWAIARGFQATGVSTMQIDAGLDTGAVLVRRETPICPDETAPELSRRLAVMGADLLIETLDGLDAGTLKATPQDDSRATLAPILKKDDGWIDWARPALAIHNQIRGLQPWPGAWTKFRGQSLHVWRARMAAASSELASGLSGGQLAPGALLCEGGVFAIGGDGAALELLEVQLGGRKKMPADVFANGHRLTRNDLLGA